MSRRARATALLLRHTLKPILAATDNITVLRAAMGCVAYRLPRRVRRRPAWIGEVAGEWIEPRQGPVRGTLLYLHGGGYFACSPRTHRPYSAWFACHGWQVFVPDYRRAPEHPFPAAVEDARAAFAAMPTHTVVAGDSAGGGLALALMVAERDAGRPQPAAAALFSPWTDLAVTGESVVENARRCAMFNGDILRRGAAVYLGGAAPTDALASPLYADLEGLPPLLIHAGEHETLRDDARRLAERADAAGVRVSLRLWPDVPHVWQLFHPYIPEGRASLALATAFLNAPSAQ